MFDQDFRESWNDRGGQRNDKRCKPHFTPEPLHVDDLDIAGELTPKVVERDTTLGLNLNDDAYRFGVLRGHWLSSLRILEADVSNGFELLMLSGRGTIFILNPTRSRVPVWCHRISNLDKHCSAP